MQGLARMRMFDVVGGCRPSAKSGSGDVVGSPSAVAGLSRPCLDRGRGPLIPYYTMYMCIVYVRHISHGR